MITDGWTDARMDARTMAVGSSVTWTHCSVRYEVTWGKKARVRVDAPSVRADEVISLPSPSLCTQFFLVVGCWKREEKNVRFSIPKIPKIPKFPELRVLRGRSCEKKKVFLA
jgi:hypothetical protein